MGHRPDTNLNSFRSVSLMEFIGTDLRRWADAVWWLVFAKLYGVLHIAANQHSTDRR
jgi:hypothetical protein